MQVLEAKDDAAVFEALVKGVSPRQGPERIPGRIVVSRPPDMDGIVLGSDEFRIVQVGEVLDRRIEA